MADVAELKRRIRLAYRRVFLGDSDAEMGQMVLNHLLHFCGEGQDPFVPTQPDATGYNLGRQRVALHLRALLKDEEETP